MCPCMYTVYVPVILIEYFSSTFWDQYFHTFLTYSRCNYVIISNGLPYIKILKPGGSVPVSAHSGDI